MAEEIRIMGQLGECLIEFNSTYEEYEKKYGKGSLNRVIIGDPLEPTCESLKKDTKKLRQAIDTNTPLAQEDEEVWEKLIF